jgi:hypothetical protein
MTRLDDYRSALGAGFSEVSEEKLVHTLDKRGPQFAAFIVDHGLGPLWHARTARPEFRESRMQAEALYLRQERPLDEIGAVLDDAGIEHVVIKGAANRLLIYDNPALRACHDLDILILPEDRVRAAKVLLELGFVAIPEVKGISRGLVLSRNDVDIDLHWGLLREGRLRGDPVPAMVKKRRRVSSLWMPSPENTLFILLVHSAFAKHLGGWDMGLHRVLDVVNWLNSQTFDWTAVREWLDKQGVRTAAWATLRWVNMLTAPYSPRDLDAMLSDLRPGRLREAWINRWLQSNLSERTARAHWVRLLGFSLFLHDAPRDSVRALFRRYQAYRRRDTDMTAFRGLFDQ